MGSQSAECGKWKYLPFSFAAAAISKSGDTAYALPVVSISSSDVSPNLP
jgi:hypothetical protein